MKIYKDNDGNEYRYRIFEDSHFRPSRLWVCINSVKLVKQNINIPSAIESFPVLKIGCGAFENNDTIVSLMVPETITVIEKDAFKNCKNLSKVFLKNGLKVIETNAFQNCISLENIIIPRTLEHLSEGVFFGCHNLKWLKILSEFLYDKRLSPSFEGCYNLKEIIVNEDNKTLHTKDGILYNKSGEKLILYPTGKENEEFIVPDGVSEIADFAFYTNEYLTKIILSSYFEKIGKSAFYKCKSLRELKVYNTLKSIDAFAFFGCSKLEICNSSSYLSYIGYKAFMDCVSLKEFYLPHVEQLKGLTFKNCTNLEEIYFSENTIKIYQRCFENCINLYKINFPKSLKEIWYKAFKGCKNLFVVAFDNKDIEIADNAFDECINLIIEIPKTKNVYHGEYSFSFNGSATITFESDSILINDGYCASDSDGDSICEHEDYYRIRDIKQMVSNLEKLYKYFDISKAKERESLLYDALQTEEQKKLLLLFLSILEEYDGNPFAKDFVNFLSSDDNMYEYRSYTR